MKTAHVPSATGIYIIRNTVNGRSYVGSSTNVRWRLNAHRSQLRRGVHFSPPLSAAWAKYGEAMFVCDCLEVVPDASKLIAREQHWIDALDAVANGYNISAVAGSNLGLVHSPEWIEKVAATKRKRFPGFVSPRGVPLSIINLPAFCARNGLFHAGMSALARGKIVTHKGWTHENGKASSRQVTGAVVGLVGPDGMEFEPIHDFRGFCKARGLDRGRMLLVVRGEKVSCHGYTMKGGRKPKPRAKNYTVLTFEGFYNPSGRPVTITNMAKFCRDNGLSERQMFRVRAGRVRQCHGWTYGQPGLRPRKRPSRRDPATA